MKKKFTFERIEKKFVLTRRQYIKLNHELRKYLINDDFPKYTISSIYFDTDNHDVIRESSLKPKYKEKLRMRCYGVPSNDEDIFIEIKKKFNGVVSKRRMMIRSDEVDNFLNTHTEQTPSQISHEIVWMLDAQPIKPSIMIAYDRIALKHPTDDDFRVTFDFNMRYREYDLDLRLGHDGALVAPEVYCVMEVKTVGSYPFWFVSILSALNIRQQSFSKYGEWYHRHLIHKGEQNYVQ